MAAPFAAAHKFELTNNYKTLLKQTDVDPVAVVTPHLLHEEMAIAAFDAGKQVFCEKPMASRPRVPSALWRPAPKPAASSVSATSADTNPQWKRCAGYSEQLLGRVLHLDANVSHNNFRKMDPSNWRRDPKHAPAGAWTALGIHLGDMFVSFAGQPIRVERAHRFADIFPAPSEDFVSAEIDFANGARGRITCLSTPPFYGRFTLVCDQGWVEAQEGGNVDKGIPVRALCTVQAGRQPRRRAAIDAHQHRADRFRGLGRRGRGRAPLSLFRRQLLANIRILDAVGPARGGGGSASPTGAD